MAKGFLISVVLVIVTDSMNIGSWMILPPFTYPLFKVISFIIVLCRSVILFISIIYMIVNNLIMIQDEGGGGIFENIFGYTILHPFRTLVVNEQQQQQQYTSWISTFNELKNNDSISNNNIVERTSTTINNTSWTAFRGQGRVLGSSGGDVGNNHNIGGNNTSYLTASSRRSGRDTSSSSII